MSVTLSIPLTTLNTNQVVNIPSTAIGSETSVTFTIDRTAGTHSLNAGTQDQPAIVMLLEYSQNGGSTWPTNQSQTIDFGIYKNKSGVTATSTVITDVFPPSTTHVRGSVTAKQTVSVQGSVVLSP